LIWTCGVSKNGCPFRDIAGHDAAGADDGIVTDRHSWKDDRASTDPYIVSYLDGPSTFQALFAQLRIPRMIGGEDLDVRPNFAAVSDINPYDVQKYTTKM